MIHLYSQARGISPAIFLPFLIALLYRDLGIPFEVEVLPWSEGYAALQESDNIVLFTTSLNEARRDQFKWAGPFAALE